MGRAQGSRRTRGPLRNTLRPGVEALDDRLLLSAASFGGKLGPFVEPGAIRPRIRQAPVVADAAPQVNQYLINLLGSEELAPIREQASARGVNTRAFLYNRVLAQPLTNTILGAVDTYTVLNSPALQQLVGYVAIQPSTQDSETVRYLLAPENVVIAGEEARVEVPPNDSLSGFFATVPTTNIRILTDGRYQVDIPIDQVPPDAPPPEISTVGIGTLSPVYRATGPVLSQALLTGLHQRGPNTPQVVRGLRTARLPNHPRLIAPGTQSNFLRLIRVAVEREAFVPNAEQNSRIATGLQTFLTELNQLTANGTFNPPVPPETPSNPFAGATLGSTLQVTSGAVRDLLNVAPSQSGLPLGGLNFSGRIDAGFVIAANGDYGLVLSARGPLQAAPAGYSTDVVGGDLRVEVTNATSLDQLNGLRIEEGTYLGSVLSGAVTSSRTSTPSGDLVALGTAAGFGTGLDFGTGVSYTKIIPLGNLNALLPSSPPSG